jgi:hypothetical protein
MTPTADAREPTNEQNDDDFVTTHLTNPGIIDRLEKDIANYLSPFGFILKRHVSERGEMEMSSCSINDGAVLVVPRLPNSYSYNTHANKVADNFCATNEANATNSAVISSLTGAGPIRILHLTIHDASLLATVGPLLRTFLRLTPHHIHPQHLRTVIRCNFSLDALEKINKMSLDQKLDHLNRQEEVNARRMTHYVHMLMRNSMGSALCLQLVIVLPCYWRRKSALEENVVTINGGNSSYNRTNVPITVNSVMMAMRNNPDACYPTVQLIEQCDTAGMTEDHPLNGELDPTALCLNVRTRMCTVRHQPLIFRWISSWQNHTINQPCEVMHPEPQRVRRLPLIVTCIEKVGNLHRILMLLYDHHENYYTKSASERMSTTELVIVMPMDDKSRRNVVDAVDFIGEERGSQHHEDRENCIRPILVYEAEAARIISELVIQRQTTCSTQALPRFVGIDLHPDAHTLVGDYATASPTSPALQTVRDADVILFGYESTGIPNNIAQLVNSWVQIPSRSSINVVAAMSIVLDALT